MTLRAAALAHARGDRPLFAGVNLHVDAGEALWVRGRNGSGKTSLLRVLCGLSAPSEGAVQWRGRDVVRWREDLHRELLYVGHASGLKDDFTAAQNLRLGARLRGHDVDAESVLHALANVGLARVAHRPAGWLSQGQRRRLALARLHLPPTPKLLVLDEPFAALDAEGASDLRAALDRHLLKGGIVVYTTHQPVSLRATRLHVLDLDPQRPPAC